jgi:cystathionine gamma-synthase
LDPSSLVVRLGRPAVSPGAPVNPPVVLTATYHAGGDATYGRDANATWDAFEAALGALEGGSALAFASGMGAIASVVETLPVGACVVVPADAYQGVRLLLGDLAALGRVAVRSVDVANTEGVLAVCADVGGPPGLLWLESPTNPLLAIADLPALISGAHRLGMLVAVDNTVATPLLQRPLDFGADVVVHSVTKLLAGHSDLVLGAAVVRDPALLTALTRQRSLHGAVPGPLETFLALRGLRTLAVRLERAQASAGELARRLAADAAVAWVRYPGLPSHPGHSLARSQMRGFGTMIAFQMGGGGAAADAVCEGVRLIVHGTSLGGVESLIEHRSRYPAEAHLPPGVLRLSVGIEHVDDLWADLQQASAAAIG